MSIELTSPPAIEPISIAEAAQHLRLDATSYSPVPDAPAAARLIPASAGALSVGVYRYRVTFVTADGETDGGTISAPVTIVDPLVNGRVSVAEIPIGGAEVTARRIYRTVASGSAYFLVATIADNSTTTYTDNIADAALGAGIPTANSTGDPVLYALIIAARDHVEQYTGRRLMTQTWREYLDAFPATNPLTLTLAPMQSVTTLQYVASDGTLTTLDPATYVMESATFLGRVRAAHGVSWPTTRDEPQAVRVTYVVGYGSTPQDVPPSIRAAMKLLIGHWFANREAVITGTIASPTPLAVEALLAPYRMPRVP